MNEPLTPEEINDLLQCHIPGIEQFMGIAACQECGEPAPCSTARALTMLTQERARRLWAERHLRAQRLDKGTLAHAPEWSRETNQELYLRLAAKSLTTSNAALPSAPQPLRRPF